MLHGAEIGIAEVAPKGPGDGFVNLAAHPPALADGGRTEENPNFAALCPRDPHSTHSRLQCLGWLRRALMSGSPPTCMGPLQEWCSPRCWGRVGSGTMLR